MFDLISCAFKDSSSTLWTLAGGDFIPDQWPRLYCLLLCCVYEMKWNKIKYYKIKQIRIN